MATAPTTHPAQGKLGRFWLPLAWVVLVMALSVRFLWQAWPALNDYRLPGAATFLIEAEMIAAAITLLAGLLVLALGLARSHLFPWAFALWQGFDILVMAASTIYTLMQPDFMMTPLSFLIVGVQALVGAGFIALIFKSPERGGVFAARARQGMPLPAWHRGRGFLGLLRRIGCRNRYFGSHRYELFRGCLRFFRLFRWPRRAAPGGDCRRNRSGVVDAPEGGLSRARQLLTSWA